MTEQIEEYAAVVLTEDRTEARLRAGDVGTVVMVHAGGKGYEVEFTTLGGDTLSVLTLPAGALRAIRADEIAHARAVA